LPVFLNADRLNNGAHSPSPNRNRWTLYSHTSLEPQAAGGLTGTYHDHLTAIYPITTYALFVWLHRQEDTGRYEPRHLQKFKTLRRDTGKTRSSPTKRPHKSLQDSGGSIRTTRPATHSPLARPRTCYAVSCTIGSAPDHVCIVLGTGRQKRGVCIVWVQGVKNGAAGCHAA
jgi:hypothetical protein